MKKIFVFCLLIFSFKLNAQNYKMSEKLSLFMMGLLNDYGFYYSEEEKNLFGRFSTTQAIAGEFLFLGDQILEILKINECINIKVKKNEIRLFNQYLSKLLNKYFNYIYMSSGISKDSGKRIEYYRGTIDTPVVLTLDKEEILYLLAGIFRKRYFENKLYLYGFTTVFLAINEKYHFFEIEEEKIEGFNPGRPNIFRIIRGKETFKAFDNIYNDIYKYYDKSPFESY